MERRERPDRVAHAARPVRPGYHPGGHGAGGEEGPWRIASFVVFVAASLTDSVDGEIARRQGLVTDFGIVADPIADKALTGTALIGLSRLTNCPGG